MGKSVLTIAVCTLPLLLGFMAADANPGESSEEVSCPSGWEQLHRGCYMFVETEMSWSDALNHCTMQNGELTSIQSWKEKEELNTYLRSSKTSTLKWWVGLQRGSSPSSDWKWLQDYPLDSNLIPWSNPRLRTRPGNVCGMIDISSSKFQVSNDRCTAEHPFICEYHNIVSRPILTITEATSIEVLAESTTQPSTTSPPQTTDNCPCRDTGDVLSSDSSESHESRLRRQNEALNTNEELYQKYLQSEIDANKAKVVYYTEVTRVYQEALEAQRQYYNSYQAKIDLEINQLREGPKCT